MPGSGLRRCRCRSCRRRDRSPSIKRWPLRGVRSPRRRCAGCPSTPLRAARRTPSARSRTASERLGCQRQRTKDQVGVGRLDGRQVGISSGSPRRAAHGSRCPGTTVDARSSGSAAATMRDCRPSAHNASSWSPESTTMRCGSARTSVAPATAATACPSHCGPRDPAAPRRAPQDRVRMIRPVCGHCPARRHRRSWWCW